MGKLQDRIAIITGAASGIGQACAELFAREGAKVVVADIQDQAGERVAKDIGGCYLHVDLTDPAQVEGMIKRDITVRGRERGQIGPEHKGAIQPDRKRDSNLAKLKGHAQQRNGNPDFGNVKAKCDNDKRKDAKPNEYQRPAESGQSEYPTLPARRCTFCCVLCFVFRGIHHYTIQRRRVLNSSLAPLSQLLYTVSVCAIVSI